MHAVARSTSTADDLVDFTLAGTGSVGDSVDNDLGGKLGVTFPIAEVGLLTLVPSAVGESVFPAEVVEVGDVVAEEEDVGVHGRFEDFGNGGGTRFAALRLEESEPESVTSPSSRY